MRYDETEEAVRDLDEALRIAGGSRELVDELFQQFCAELPGRMATISELAVARDYERLREALHQLKGGAVVCAVKPLVTALEDLHRAVKSAPHEDVPRLLAILQERADELSKVFAG
jgi:HPt (histidine-containing phosphotransfer) domain-containing protein